MRTPPGTVVTRELAAIRRAFRRAEQAILRAEAPEEGFQAADQFAGALRELAHQDGMLLVSRAAARLRAARRYSLAELARAVEIIRPGARVSKSMAAYWDRRARKE